MYEFTKPDQWDEIEDFMADHSEAEGSFEKELSLSGFSTEPVVIGDPRRSSLSLEIYRKNNNDAPYDFVAVVDIGGTGELVAIADLPDLLAFLQVIVPLGVQIDTLAMMRDQSAKEPPELTPMY